MIFRDVDLWFQFVSHMLLEAVCFVFFCNSIIVSCQKHSFLWNEEILKKKFYFTFFLLQLFQLTADFVCSRVDYYFSPAFQWASPLRFWVVCSLSFIFNRKIILRSQNWKIYYFRVSSYFGQFEHLIELFLHVENLSWIRFLFGQRLPQKLVLQSQCVNIGNGHLNRIILEIFFLYNNRIYSK